jgi:serine/threonine protein kinase
VLELNQVFASRYRIVRHIADGGMGAVYEAEHLGTEARVALKVLWPQVVQAASARRRFELEAKIAARVDSEHIVKVLDAGYDPEKRTPYLVMELLIGSTLAARIKTHGPLSPILTLELMRQLARGLDSAHNYRSAEGARHPIVHRDLKPENLFVSVRADGSPLLQILDFGIAKVMSEATNVSQELRGTPLFMAFEQAAGETLSPQTDIWALGLITYHSLTGRHYWPAANRSTGSLQALFAEILTLPLPPPSRRLREDGIRLSLPRGFDGWLLRCLDRKPQQRFASAGQAVQALQQALNLFVPPSTSSAPVRPAAPSPPRFAPRRMPNTATFEAPIPPEPRARPAQAASPVSTLASHSVSAAPPAARKLHTRGPMLAAALTLLTLALLPNPWPRQEGVVPDVAPPRPTPIAPVRQETIVQSLQAPPKVSAPPPIELAPSAPSAPRAVTVAPSPPPSARRPSPNPPASKPKPAAAAPSPVPSPPPPAEAPPCVFDPYTARCKPAALDELAPVAPSAQPTRFDADR